VNRRSRMPKRGNPARQDSAQGFAFRKDITDNFSLKLDRASEGGISGNLRRYHWSGKVSGRSGNTTSQPPIADVYDAKKMRRGGAGLWRRKRRRRGRRKGQMPGGGMPQGFGQGAQYGAPPMSMLGNLGGMGGM
jgi:hypothetical protein